MSVRLDNNLVNIDCSQNFNWDTLGINKATCIPKNYTPKFNSNFKSHDYNSENNWLFGSSSQQLSSCSEQRLTPCHFLDTHWRII